MRAAFTVPSKSVRERAPAEYNEIYDFPFKDNPRQVSAKEIARRRSANKAARASRKANRRSGS